MNENSSSQSSTSAPHHGLTAEAISRRAYELWEQEGRPESRDLHHWLRAEQQLLAEQNAGSAANSNAGAARAPNTDQPLQSPRASATAPGAKAAPPKRSAPAASGDKQGQAAGRSTQPGMRTAGRS
jgi:hypothetical protein